MKTKTDSAAPFDGPLFLVGMPRSGTKLLRALLDRHPQVALSNNETEFLPYLVTRWDSFGDVSDEKVFRNFYRTVKKFPYMQARARHGDLISCEEWYRTCARFDAAAVFEALVRYDTKAPFGSGIIWGDKSPGYIRKIPMLKTLYPSARIVHIIRDVRDHCVSMRKAWGKNIYRSAQRWHDDVSWARKCGQDIDAYLEVRYENILREPEREIRAIAEFIGVDFVPEMTELIKPSERLGEAKNTARIVRDNFGKYRGTLSSQQILSIEEIAADSIRALDYELTSNVVAKRLPKWRMAFYRLLDGINILTTGMRRLGPAQAVRMYFRTFVVSPNRID